MKKMLALILILAMVPVVALGADYSSLSDDELMVEMKAIQAEIFSRSVAKDGVTIHTGTYIIGEDIPAGKYRLVFQSSSGQMWLYKDENNKGTSDLVGETWGVSEIGKVVFEDGMTFILDGISAIIYEYTGLFN